MGQVANRIQKAVDSLDGDVPHSLKMLFLHLAYGIDETFAGQEVAIDAAKTTAQKAQDATASLKAEHDSTMAGKGTPCRHLTLADVARKTRTIDRVVSVAQALGLILVGYLLKKFGG